MPGLIRGVARTAVIAGTATAVSNRVSRRQARRWGEQQYYEEPADQPAPPTAGAGGDDTIARLRELGELRNAGVLTEDEFQAQKQRIFAG